MQFAINWSPEAAELLAAGLVEIDLFKCPDWEDLVADAQAQSAAYVHFPLAIGNGQHTNWDFGSIHDWLDTTSTDFVNCHILPSEQCFAEDISLDELIPALTQEVQLLVNEFGAERVIIENCPYYVESPEKGHLPQGIEARVFHEIIAETGCGFLLDMAHAIMTTDYLDGEFEDYICRLPIAHIREFHITGISAWQNGILGDHMPLEDRDWQYLDFCMQHFKSGKWRTPDLIAFEYGGIGMLKEKCGSDKMKIAEQVPRLYALAHSLATD